MFYLAVHYLTHLKLFYWLEITNFTKKVSETRFLLTKTELIKYQQTLNQQFTLQHEILRLSDIKEAETNIYALEKYT